MDPLHSEPLTARCAIAIYDPVELHLHHCRAGLPEPVEVFPDGTSAVLPASPGPLSPGKSNNAPFPATTVGLPEGSTLAMGTAALADEVLARSGPLHPLLDGASTRPPSELRDTIASAFRGSPSNETLLLLLARTKALPADHARRRPPDHPQEPRSPAKRPATSWQRAWTRKQRPPPSSSSVSSSATQSATAPLPCDCADTGEVLPARSATPRPAPRTSNMPGPSTKIVVVDHREPRTIGVPASRNKARASGQSSRMAHPLSLK